MNLQKQEETQIENALLKAAPIFVTGFFEAWGCAMIGQSIINIKGGAEADCLELLQHLPCWPYFICFQFN